MSHRMVQAFDEMLRRLRFDPLKPGQEALTMSATTWPCPDCGKALTLDMADMDRHNRARSTCECGFKGRTRVHSKPALEYDCGGLDDQGSPPGEPIRLSEDLD